MSEQSSLSHFGTGDSSQTDQYECGICGRSSDSASERTHLTHQHNDKDEKKYQRTDWLRHQYHELGKTLSEIAEEVDVSPTTISNWMGKQSIETRSRGGQVANPQLKDAEFLREEYHDRLNSPPKIADKLGVTSNTVNRWIQKHDITPRSRAETSSLVQLGDDADLERFRNEDWVRGQYVEQELTCEEIGDKINVSEGAVRRKLARSGIERRSQKKAQEIAQLDNPESLHTDREWLREQYIENGLTQAEIAEEFDVTDGAISYWLQKHDIETRSKSEAFSEGDIKKLQDAEWVERQYIERERTAVDIAEQLGVADSTVLSYAESHGIDRREKSEIMAQGDIEPLKSEDWLRKNYHQNQKTVGKIAEELGVSTAPVYTWMDRHGIETRGEHTVLTEAQKEKLENEKWLRRKYWQDGSTLREIASLIEVSSGTIRRWMKEHDIESRTRVESVYYDGDNSSLSKLEASNQAYVRLTNADWLQEQYLNTNLSTHQIGEELEVDASTVGAWMEKHGIERRCNQVANSIRQSDTDLSRLRDAGWVREKYWRERMNTYEIAQEIGTTSSTVSSWMNRHGIEVRSADLAYSMSLSEGDISQLREKDWLKENYSQKERSLSEISEEFEVSTTVVRRWIQKNDIEIRSPHRDPDHLDHAVRSGWELAIANLLVDIGVEYGYESVKIGYGENRRYTPDFVTENYIIECKGRDWGMVYDRGVTAEQKAKAAMKQLDDREYVVVGIQLPCDVHIPWEERGTIQELFG